MLSYTPEGYLPSRHPKRGHMGSLQALEMARLTDLDTGLRWHLQSNHYPPIPLSMVEPCKAAIDAYGDEDYRREIPLPDGVSYRGRPTAPASAIVTEHHLDAFINQEDE